MTAEEMMAVGYCCIIRRYRHVSRIDRPDWQDAMKPIFPATVEAYLKGLEI